MTTGTRTGHVGWSVSDLNLPLNVHWLGCRSFPTAGSEGGDLHFGMNFWKANNGLFGGQDFLQRKKLPFADKVCQPEEMSK